ncbi:MAG: PRTRC system protein E [Rhodoferax sp.]|nr:PRTRC system protein E [Rhodoferax sp.]
MTFFKKIEDLMKSGVTLQIHISQVGEEMRLDIIPACDSGATGVSIPPCSLLGTPEDLDGNIADFLGRFSHNAVDLKGQMAAAMAALEEAKNDAASATKMAQEKAASTREKAASTRAGKGAPSTVSKPKNSNAGFSDLDPENDHELGYSDDDDDIPPTPTPLPAPAAVAPPPSLF